MYNLNHVQTRGQTDLTPFVVFALEGLVQELEAVHAEVLAEVRIIAFRDYARQVLDDKGRLATSAGERQLRFLIELARGPVSLKDLRSGAHPLSRLYRSVTTRTLMRDISFMKEQGLLVTDGDTLKARLDLMSRYTV